MKVVLFCGGLGMRMREYSESIPKPMVPIGYRPVVWHLMRYYAHFGHTDFVLCLGYRGDVIKDYFLNYHEAMSNDFVLRKGGDEIELLQTDIDQWNITFVDTGMRSNVGERLALVRDHVAGEERFLANYADGLSDVDLDEMLKQHLDHDAVATFAAVLPRHSFHVVDVSEDDRVRSVQDASAAGLRINGGFFVFEQEVFDYMQAGDDLIPHPFERMIRAGRLYGYRYDGFWGCMDTFKDRETLEELHHSGDAPWQRWSTNP